MAALFEGKKAVDGLDGGFKFYGQFRMFQSFHRKA